MIHSKNLFLILQQKKIHKKILHDISCHIKKAKITTFIGNSGGGKTSLLKCMATLYKDYQGDILVDGIDLKILSPKERAQLIGFVFQQFNLFPHMTVKQNCMHPILSVLNVSKTIAEEKALEILDMLGMREHQNSYPAQLSGGQQQRVAIARALALGPQVLLLDEPTSALDPQSSKSLQDILKNLCKTGITIVLSSHDMTFVRGVSDEVYFVEAGVIADAHDLAQGAVNSESKIGLFLNHN